MPLPSRLARQLGTAIPNIQNDQYAQDRGADAFNGVTNEVIDFVYSDGSYGVSGMHLTTTGVSQPLIVGQVVQVGWRGGVAQAILSHTALRSKYTPLGVQSGTPVIEELFVDGTTIWFRNGDQFTPLLTNSTSLFAGPVKPADLGLTAFGAAHWGKGSANFVCVEGLNGTDVVWVVCSLNRPKPNEPFPRGFKVRIRPVRAYNLSTDPATFGSYSITVTSGGTHVTSATLKYVNPFITVSGAPDTPIDMRADAFIEFAALAPNADLLVTLRITATAIYTVDGSTVVSFTQGSLLINVTHTLILANHLASFQGTTAFAVPGCASFGTVEVAVTTGVSPVVAGVITVLSAITTNPKDPTSAGTFNNYALVGPATFQGNDTGCYAARPTLILSIVGEFVGQVLTFPGASTPQFSQTPLIQGSRTMLLIGTFSESGQSLTKLRIAWLPTREVSTIANAESFQSFGTDSSFTPFFPQSWIQARAYFVTQASQVYSPRESLPYSFNVQHPPLVKRPVFIASALSKGTGTMSIDFKNPKATLNGFGFIAPAKTPAQQTILTTIPMSDLQVIDSKTTLKTAFQSGPL